MRSYIFDYLVLHYLYHYCLRSSTHTSQQIRSQNNAYERMLLNRMTPFVERRLIKKQAGSDL